MINIVEKFWNNINLMAALYYNDMLSNDDLHFIAEKLTNENDDQNLIEMLVYPEDEKKVRRSFSFFLANRKIEIKEPKAYIIKEVFSYIGSNKLNFIDGMFFIANDIVSKEKHNKYVGDTLGIEKIIGIYYSIDDGEIKSEKDIEMSKKEATDLIKKYIQEYK